MVAQPHLGVAGIGAWQAAGFAHRRGHIRSKVHPNKEATFPTFTLRFSILVHDAYCLRVHAWPLRQQQDAPDNEGRDDPRGKRSAQIEAAVADGLIEEVANRCPQRAGQNECGPE
jgi:hypothetical protein